MTQSLYLLPIQSTFVMLLSPEAVEELQFWHQVLVVRISEGVLQLSELYILMLVILVLAVT